jgi:hypothetical protein
MKEEKIKSLNQEIKNHLLLLILNGGMSIAQILLLIGFSNSWETLMIFGSALMVFGFGLTATIHALEISDIKQSLKSYTDGE